MIPHSWLLTDPRRTSLKRYTAKKVRQFQIFDDDNHRLGIRVMLIIRQGSVCETPTLGSFTQMRKEPSVFNAMLYVFQFIARDFDIHVYSCVSLRVL